MNEFIEKIRKYSDYSGEDGAEEDETEARGYQQEKGWTILLIDARTGQMIDPEDETAGRYVYAL